MTIGTKTNEDTLEKLATVLLLGIDDLLLENLPLSWRAELSSFMISEQCMSVTVSMSLPGERQKQARGTMTIM